MDLWEYFDAGTIAYVHCSKCGTKGPSMYREKSAHTAIEAAREAWNTRTNKGATR